MYAIPGDPAIFDGLALAGPVAALLLAGLERVLRRFRAPSGVLSVSLTAARVVVVTGLTAATLASVTGWSVIGRRHFGDWAVLTRAIQVENARIADAVGGRPLTDAELERFRSQLDARAPGFRLGNRDLEARLQVRRSDYPYVGVDFGAGRIAHFEPRTM